MVVVVMAVVVRAMWWQLLPRTLLLSSWVTAVAPPAPCVCWKKAAATKTPVAGCILVAAAHTDLGDEDERLSEYFNRPWNWESMVQGVTKKIVLFHGTDDHLIPIQEARYIAEQLEFSDKFVFYEMSGKSHFFRPWPELLTAVDDILKQC